MKISKKTLLIMGGIFSVSSLGLMFVSAAERNLSKDLNNAVQHINEVKFVLTGKNGAEATLGFLDGNLVEIEAGSGFFISEDNQASFGLMGGEYSSVLGGYRNRKGGTYDVVLGGSGNSVRGSYNSILGGEGNSITGGSYNTIIGGIENKINSKSSLYSVILGGISNMIGSGKSSVVMGTHSSVNGSHSVALGSGSKVEANNSFLWTDGRESANLDSDNVFVVMAQSGVVINVDKAHSFAKLTLGGPMILFVGRTGENITCEGGVGGGILKVVESENNQMCMCSCDGNGWSSMFGKGRCMSVCDVSLEPECGDTVTKVGKNIGGRQYAVYSGSCKKGEIVEGTGAYLVTKDNKVHWSCQSEDGLVVGCSGNVNAEGGYITVKKCGGTPPTGVGVVTGSSTYVGNGNKVWKGNDNLDENNLLPCQWTCTTGYEIDHQNGGRCKAKTRTANCEGDIPSLAEAKTGHGTYTQTWNGSTWTPTSKSWSYDASECGYKCKTNYTWDGSSCVLGTGSCGTKPTGNGYKFGTGIYTYGYTPTSWTYTGGTLGPCLYKCDSGYSWNSTTKKCEIIEYKCTTDKSTSPGYIFTLKNPMSQSEEKPWTHIADGTAQSSLNACEFTCNLNGKYYYNTTVSKCEFKTDWCNNEVVNGCQSPATGANKNSSDPSKYTWDCAINGVTMEKGCFKCKDGYALQGDTCVLEEPESTGHWACKEDYNISGTCRNIGKTAWCNLHVPRDFCWIHTPHGDDVLKDGFCSRCYQNNSSCNCNVPPNKPLPSCCATNQIEMPCNSYDLASLCNKQPFCDRTYEENNDFDYICVDDQGNELPDRLCETDQYPDCSKNLVDDGLIPVCGDNLNQCEIGDVENISSSTKTWDCVNGGESVTCEYSCSTKSVCPTGYKEENGVCKLNYRICAKTLLKTGCPIAEGWGDNLYTLSSTSCFGNNEPGYLSPGQNAGSFPNTINVQKYNNNKYYGYSSTNYCFSLDGGPQLGEECGQSANVFTEGGIFDVCGINSMKKYGNNGDNGYYIDECPKNRNLEIVNLCQVEDKCNVVTLGGF